MNLPLLDTRCGAPDTALPTDPPHRAAGPPSGRESTRMAIAADLAVVALVALAVGACAWRLREVHPDDALIVLRYARNLLDGNGWVYNPGEAVNAATSPLHVLVVAAIGACTGDLMLASWLAFALPLAAAAATAFWLFARYGRLPATMASLLVAFTPRVYATLGMESALLIATALAAAVAGTRGRCATAGALAGVATLARPDAAVLGALLAGLAWRRHGRRACLRLTLAAAVVVLPFAVFATARFGSALPSTLAVKLAQRRLFADPPIFLRGAWRELAALDERAVGVTAPMVLAWALAVTAVLAWRARRHPAVAAFAAWAWSQFACYALFDLPPYHWYYAPALAAVALGAAVTFATCWQTRRPLPMLAGIVLGGATIAACLPELVAPQPTRPHYREAGAWLAQHTPATASVAVADIGIVGFLAHPRPIVDMQGLVTPGGAAAIAAGDTGWWFDHHRPDYVVVHTVPWRDFEAPVLARSDFARAYRHRPDARLRGLEVWEHVSSVSGSGPTRPIPARRR